MKCFKLLTFFWFSNLESAGDVGTWLDVQDNIRGVFTPTYSANSLPNRGIASNAQ